MCAGAGSPEGFQDGLRASASRFPAQSSVLLVSPGHLPLGTNGRSASGLGAGCHHLWTQRNSDPCGLSAGRGLCSSPGGRTLNNCEGVGRPAGKSPCFHVNVPAPQTLSGERTLLCVERKFKAIKLETVSTKGRKADRAEARAVTAGCVCGGRRPRVGTACSSAPMGLPWLSSSLSVAHACACHTCPYVRV